MGRCKAAIVKAGRSKVMRLDQTRVLKQVCFSVALPLFAATSMSVGAAQEGGQEAEVAPSLNWLAYRVRSDASVALNADAGWAAPENAMTALHYDSPFRLRVQVLASEVTADGHQISLQYRANDDAWKPVGYAHFPYPSLASPLVSIIKTDAYQSGDETTRLLGEATQDWDDGLGLNAEVATPVWRETGNALEWEWPLVVRRFSDGPTFSEDGLSVDLRLVNGIGQPLAGVEPLQLTLSAEPGHLGGTFIETPGRIGPYQTGNGSLYFFMEPTETDNRFMAMISTDYGNSWREVDGENRPDADDLEGVAAARHGDVIHLIHQQSEEVFYHAFDLSAGAAGQWLVNSESIAQPAEPPTQYADLIARQDGSLVALYAGDHKLFMQFRDVHGNWTEPGELDTDMAPDLSGPVMAVGDDGQVTLAYTALDGQGFVRHLRADNTLTDRQQISSDLGTRDIDNGAIAPLVIDPETGDSIIVYRESDGMLYERRLSHDGELSALAKISDMSVVTGAVDSEQVGADLIYHNGVLHLLFIEEASRDIYHTQSSEPGVWQQPMRVVDNIQGGWVRGSVHLNQAGEPVYGFVYDAGSKGGSGFNRYMALPLN